MFYSSAKKALGFVSRKKVGERRDCVYIFGMIEFEIDYSQDGVQNLRKSVAGINFEIVSNYLKMNKVWGESSKVQHV